MYNFEYYGFSLLCYIQRECNSHFREGRDFSGDNVLEVQRVLNYELRMYPNATASGRPAPGKFIDYSEPAEVAELDLVSKWFDGKLGEVETRALGDACYELGLAGLLWQISQWTPDRKRSALVMVDDTGPAWSRGRIIAASVSNKSLRLDKKELKGYVLKVTSSQMERLCVRFNELRQKAEAESKTRD